MTNRDFVVSQYCDKINRHFYLGDCSVKGLMDLNEILSDLYNHAYIEGSVDYQDARKRIMEK